MNTKNFLLSIFFLSIFSFCTNSHAQVYDYYDVLAADYSEQSTTEQYMSQQVYTEQNLSNSEESSQAATYKDDFVDEIIEECREELGEYCAHTTCTNFANCTHVICNNKGLGCKTVGISCSASGHEFNLVEDPETGWWYVVDSTRGQMPYNLIYTDIKFVSISEICSYLGIKNCDDCKLDFYDDPQEPTYPYTCAKKNYELGNRGGEFYEACENCCDKYVDNKNISNKPDAEDWKRECLNSCKNWSKM